MTMFLSSSLAMMVLLSTIGYSAVHKIDRTHSSVNFKIRHIFTKTTGQFRKFSGKIDFDPKAIEKSKFSFEIDASSIFTDDKDRDKHLRSKDFFWTERHPKISFKSKKTSPINNKSFVVSGILTMRGVSKPIEVNMNYLGQMKAPSGKYKAGFEASAKVNRQDFGISWNKSLDSGGVILGDMVDIEIFLETENVTLGKS